MENPRTDALTVTGQVAPRMFVQHDETGTFGLADFSVCVVHAIAGVDVEIKLP